MKTSKSIKHNFLEGMRNSFNLFPDIPKNPVSGTDSARLNSDWELVKKDICKGMKDADPRKAKK
jgi:hypothetical protein